MFREGVFFHMSDEEYHSVPALSASGMKNLRMSPLDFWVRSAFNPNLSAVMAEEGNGDSEARAIGRAFHKRIVEGPAAFAQTYAQETAIEEHPGCLKTMDDLKAFLRSHEKAVSGNKADLIARAVAVDPSVKVWETIEAQHAATHAGKHLLSRKWVEKIELAAAMIEKHRDLAKAFSGGAPEVSIFWTCPLIGVPCKARLDYLKPKSIVDLKTFTNTRGLPLSRAVAMEMGARRYHVQAAFYAEAATHVARFLREEMTDADQSDAEREPFRSLRAGYPKTFLFVMQSKGVAPAALGRTFLPQSVLFAAANREIEQHKMTFRTCMDNFGPDTPWVEASEIETFADEDFPEFVYR